MYKNVIISILAVIVMIQTGFIQPSNTAAYILAPMVWYLLLLASLNSVDAYIRAKKMESRQERVWRI